MENLENATFIGKRFNSDIISDLNNIIGSDIRSH